LNGKFFNLEYGAAAPGAPAVFLDDSEFKVLWTSGKRYYLVATQKGADRIENLIGREYFGTVSASGGKFLLTNVAAKDPSSIPVTAPMQPVASSFLSPLSGNNVPH
jgi:hypothetical protein